MLRYPPRRRPYRAPHRRSELLERLLPIPREPAKPFQQAETRAERDRLLAIEKVRYRIQAHVYAACDPEQWEWSYDDAYDPIIDYEALKARYKIFAWAGLPDSDDEAEMEIVVRLPGMPAISWATLDARHAQLMSEDAAAQEWLARGGDPPPQPVPSCWVDVGSDEE
ncbi:hypothetical protein GGG16DRAFT_68154 [Schizophyllum commune]